MKAFTVMGRVLKATYEDLFLCVFMSVAFWVGLIPVVTIPMVIMGMHSVANRLANYKRVDNSFFWEGLRTNIGRGWILFLVSLLIPAAIIFNIWFYLNSEGWVATIGFAWFWLLILALSTGQYVFPLIWQQDEPDVRLALRNSVLLALRYPLYSLFMLVFQIILLAISAGLTLPLVLLYPAMIAVTQNFALTGILQEMGLAPNPPEIPAR
ncbi:MAG: hypothetical protein KDE31_22065 [Caldilineaceae bacterium]|nr:hypothetical protein [Caldilineaceae bacterium]